MKETKFQNKLFTNKVIDKRQLKALMSDIFNKYGSSKCTYVADKLKFLGFRYATQAGLSLNVEDLRVPDTKKLNLQASESYIQQVEESFNRADITSVDRFQYVIDKWSTVSDQIKDEVVKYFVQSDPFNPIYMMAFSGARGNLSQVRQLIGMRGLMSDPQGQLIGLPIKSNFREGLTVTEYIISSYGARKGIVDTALRTADSGYLTRRLVDVAQDIIVKAHDCGTKQGVVVRMDSDLTLEGRTALKDIYAVDGSLIIAKNEQINQKVIDLFVKNKIKAVEIRSSVTCELNHSICQLCYGWNLATRKLIDLGEAVGILAAQSIGEPGTQLTMRTFHTGGTFMGTLSDAVYSFDEGNLNVIGEKVNFKPERFSESEWNVRATKDCVLQLRKLDGRIASLNIPKNSSLPLLKNGALVKSNQIISKPPLEESKGSEQITKRISSDKQGLVYLDNLSLEEREDKNGNITQIAQTQGFVWVSLSDVVTVPTNTLLQVRKGDTLKPNKCIVRSSISNSFGGFYRGCSDTKNDKNTHKILLASYSSDACSINNKGKEFELIANHTSTSYKLSLTKQSFKNPIQVIGEATPNLGFENASGRIKIENYHPDSSKRSSLLNSRIHLIPEYYFSGVDSSSKEIFVKAGDFVEEGCELFSGTFAEKPGIVDILETEDETFDFVLRPGVLIDVNAKSSTLSRSNKKVIHASLMPEVCGEIGSNSYIYIEQLTFEDDSQSFLISAAETYEIPIEKEITFHNVSQSGGFKKPFKIFEKFNFLVNDGDTIKNLNVTPLLLNQLVFEFKLPKGFFNANINLTKVKNNEYGLTVDIYEKINSYLGSYNSKSIRTQKLLHEGQYLYSSSRAFESQLLTKQNSIVNSLERVSSNQRLLCLAKKSDLTIFKPGKTFPKNLQLNAFVRRGSKVTDSLYIQSAGRVLSINKKTTNKPNIGILQRSKPYLIAKNSFIKTKEGYLVRKNDLIAFLTYEVAKTEDIIQGLPRVEELLEARPPKNKAIIATIPGFVSIIDGKENINRNDNSVSTIVIQNKKGLREKYTVPALGKIVKTGDFVNVGDRLTDGQIDLRELLQTTFDFYLNIIRLDNYLASVNSFRRLQTLLISEIQNVYKSQGVDISDKHIEIIVRQMTTKVKIAESGKTTLVPGELIDLEKIRRINAIAQYHGFAIASYTPVLLGITKASLSTDSFISAASFQETARVLTKAAVEGKKDWLKGLKENVIVGRLIPAGTGFTKNQRQNSGENLEYSYLDSEISDQILDKRAMNRE